MNESELLRVKREKNIHCEEFFHPDFRDKRSEIGEGKGEMRNGTLDICYSRWQTALRLQIISVT